MMMQIEVGAAGREPARWQATEGIPTDPAALAATLVMALEQALRVAHALLAGLESGTDHHLQAAWPAACSPGTTLSRRETEVLRLLAAGQSNRQIAAALFLSPRTVQRHIANLYPKIGTHCRAEATAYALRHGFA